MISFCYSFLTFGYFWGGNGGGFGLFLFLNTGMIAQCGTLYGYVYVCFIMGLLSEQVQALALCTYHKLYSICYNVFPYM